MRDNFPDMFVVNSKHGCDDLVPYSFGGQLTNLCNFMVVEFGMCFIRMSALSHLILHVLKRCAKGEMLWIYTMWNITGMYNKNIANRNSQIVKHPANSMSIHNSTSRSNFSVGHSFSPTFFGAFPKPASMCFSNFIPEPFFERWIKSLSLKKNISKFFTHVKNFLFNVLAPCWVTPTGAPFYLELSQEGVNK